MISLLVISDIHATATDLDDDSNVSWMSTLPAFNTRERNPFIQIPELLENENLKVDYVICPGDLADGADSAVQAATWQHLEQLRAAVGAKRLMGTVGNHDIDSRLNRSEFDPKSSLQALRPTFPGLEEAGCDFYWSRNFAVLKDEDVRIVLVNSCAFHGIMSLNQDDSTLEYLHGRISDQTTDAILRHLKGDACKLNILVVHHHIYKNEHIFSKDYSQMEGGLKLVRALTENGLGPWLVIHGHQHYPDLFYASGGADTPTILSAGSMSRRLSGPLANRALNQIYHLEIPIDKFDEIGWKPIGLARAWDWLDQIGWRRTGLQNSEAAIPYGAGFGCRKQSDAWAAEIARELTSAPGKKLDWSELVDRIPALRYVLPKDLRAVINHLKTTAGAHTLYDTDGFPAQVGIK